MTRTMESVIKHGASVWNRALLPPDEFEERRIVVDRAARDADAVAVAAVEDAYTPGLVAYLTNYKPAGGLATVVCAAGADATLLAGMGGGRDHPFIKTMSYVQDVRWFPRIGQGVATVLEQKGVTGGRLLLAGLPGSLSRPRADALLTDLDGFEIVPWDEGFSGLRRRKRERELVAMRFGQWLLDEAVTALHETLRKTSDVHTALVAAERVARLRGSRDFRALALARDGSLRPWPAGLGSAGGWSAQPITVYLSVEHLGYWAERGVTVAARASNAQTYAAAALEAAQDALRPGASGAALVAAVQDELGARAGSVTLEAAGIGLAPVECPMLGQDDGEVAEEGDVICLRAWSRVDRSLVAATSHVVVQPDGCAPVQDVVPAAVLDGRPITVASGRVAE